MVTNPHIYPDSLGILYWQDAPVKYSQGRLENLGSSGKPSGTGIETVQINMRALLGLKCMQVILLPIQKQAQKWGKAA